MSNRVHNPSRCPPLLLLLGEWLTAGGSCWVGDRWVVLLLLVLVGWVLVLVLGALWGMLLGATPTA